MGRKAISPVNVICDQCGKQYSIKGKRYNQHIKLGYKIFACSPTCRGKYANTQITERGRRKGTSPSAGWRLRKIQRQELFKSQIVKVQNDAKLELLEWLEEREEIQHEQVCDVDGWVTGCKDNCWLCELESKLKEG